MYINLFTYIMNLIIFFGSFEGEYRALAGEWSVNFGINEIIL